MIFKTQNNFTAKRQSNDERAKFSSATSAVTEQESPSITPEQGRRTIAEILRDNENAMLKEAFQRIQQQQAEQRRQRPRRRTGSVRLSNTDSIGRAMQIRSRLLAKLKEVYGSSMDERSRGATAMDIKIQLDRVERQISAIRRRERALREEKTTRRENDTPEARRRRMRDKQESRIHIRRDFLYHANRGGFDPNDPLFMKGTGSEVSSVSFDFGGKAGTLELSPGVESSPEFNMEVIL